MGRILHRNLSFAMSQLHIEEEEEEDRRSLDESRSHCVDYLEDGIVGIHTIRHRIRLITFIYLALFAKVCLCALFT